MGSALQRAWMRRGLVAWILWPASLIYGLLASLRRALYRHGILRTECVPVPVVVVGNLVAGGSGKTPVVLALVEHLHSRGYRPGVISRGYGRRSDECSAVLPESNAHEVGDEPLLIARLSRVPVFVARRRIEAARALLKLHPQTDVIVSDDGLQHYALHRDIEICMFDRRGAGNGMLLPAGPLREPLTRGADLTLCDAAAPIANANVLTRSLVPWAVSADGSRVALKELRGRPLLAVAAIANPEAFFDMLSESGLTPSQTMALPDHHAFDDWAAPSAELTVVCTEKDAVKLQSLQPDALAIALRLDFAPSFLATFDRLLDARLSSPDGPKTS